MGSTIRDLGNTIKEAKKSKRAGELQFDKVNHDNIQDDEVFEDEEESYLDSQRPVSEIMLGAEDNMSQIQHQMSACQENEEQEEQQTTLREEGVIFNNEEEGDEDVIDIDNPEDLAARGLRRIQIDGEDEEYLMDLEGNIYDLQGNYIGTTD